MRVLYVTWRFPKLSETFVMNEARELLAKGVDVRVVSLRTPEFPPPPDLAERVLQVPAIDLGRGLLSPPLRDIYEDDYRVRLLAPAYAKAIVRALGSWRPDVVHCHFVNRPAPIALKVARDMGVPCTLVAHAGDWIVDCTPRALASKVEHADHVFTISHVTLKSLAEKIGGAGTEKMSVLRASYRFAPSSTDLDLPPRYVISVARLVPKKGLDIAIKAIARARANGAEIPLVIIGAGSELEALRDLAARLHVGDLVRFLGARQTGETQKAILGAQAMLLPCRVLPDGDADGIPVALMEAGAAGISVITTPVAGIGELIQDGVSGCLVAPEDVDAVSDKLIELWRDGAKRERIGRALQAAVREEFAPELQASRLISQWSTLVENHARRP
ncbi:glycosyltransferase involved in cell wall biosynthesis [Micromonospora palomenae]|uniref:Glycosyltransferase involved in cell wall biosynthesis n=1 Tax=Micromonospora palomenae TaxID=1461247 RepID=A0A561VHT0_9ACTN|nr:glycosyltransferase [Micromonospora palomenae]TWG11178.1 glycosyltransferase involved in cell wall biosynthesis [Micromonospora palomenae]